MLLQSSANHEDATMVFKTSDMFVFLYDLSQLYRTEKAVLFYFNTGSYLLTLSQLRQLYILA